MDELGVESPEAELKIWLEERESILKQNQNYSVKVKGTSESAATNPSA
jgi:flagellar motility protein MotE (MotC chaperone)